MVTLKGRVKSCEVFDSENLVVEPEGDVVVKFTATEGGILIREWQSSSDNLYRTQHFLPTGSIIHTVSEKKLE